MRKTAIIFSLSIFILAGAPGGFVSAQENGSDLLQTNPSSTSGRIESDYFSSSKKWLLLARTNLVYKKFDASLGYTIAPRYQLNLGYTQFPDQEGFHPVEMMSLSGWYYLDAYRMEGLHLGIGLTGVLRENGIYSTDRKYRREKFGLLYQLGYDSAIQIGQQQIIISSNIGYGSGSPYVREVDESSRSFMGGIFEFSYIELGIGKRF